MKFDKSRLAAMQSEQRPRLDWRIVVSPKDPSKPIADDEVAALSAYFSKFLEPTGSCPCCDRRWGQSQIEHIFNRDDITFLEWGIARGEAHCISCGYPHRVFHRDVGPIHAWDYGFAYHPDELSFEKAEEARA